MREGILHFGFVLSDSMFPGNYTITRKILTEEEAITLTKENTHRLSSACNHRHVGSVKKLKEIFGDLVPVPDVAPQNRLYVGDSILIMALRGLPRLQEAREWTDDEIAAGHFEYALYSVVA